MPLSVWPVFKFLSVFGYQYTDKKYPKMAILIKKKPMMGGLCLGYFFDLKVTKFHNSMTAVPVTDVP